MAENSITQFRFYCGEKQNPFEGVDQNKAMLWYYEECFAIGGVDNDLPEYIGGYKAAGLGSFAEGDGVPIGLKAFLFNRYAKGAQSMRSAAEGFKGFYQKYYQ